LHRRPRDFRAQWLACLPHWYFNATTRQDDFDIDVTSDCIPASNSSAAAGVNGPGLPSALATPGIDARKFYFTFGDATGAR